MRHLLDRPVEHDVFQAERARERAVVAVERRREGALLGEIRRLARRDQAVVEADAQRVVAVDRFEPAHHREILPGAADAHDLDARTLAVARAARRSPARGRRARPRRRPGLLEHRIVTRASAFRREAAFHHSSSRDRDGRDARGGPGAARSAARQRQQRASPASGSAAHASDFDAPRVAGVAECVAETGRARRSTPRSQARPQCGASSRRRAAGRHGRNP